MHYINKFNTGVRSPAYLRSFVAYPIVQLRSSFFGFDNNVKTLQWYLRLISIQCNLSSARNFAIAFFWNVFSQPYLMKFVLLDYTHFKRKRSHKIERSLNWTEWKSAFTTKTMAHTAIIIMTVLDKKWEAWVGLGQSSHLSSLQQSSPQSPSRSHAIPLQSSVHVKIWAFPAAMFLTR